MDRRARIHLPRTGDPKRRNFTLCGVDYTPIVHREYRPFDPYFAAREIDVTQDPDKATCRFCLDVFHGARGVWLHQQKGTG